MVPTVGSTSVLLSQQAFNQASLFLTASSTQRTAYRLRHSFVRECLLLLLLPPPLP